MKTLSNDFKARLESGCCALTRLWEIDVSCKKIYRFTENTRDIRYLDNNWLSQPGIEISAIRHSTKDGYDDTQIKFPVDIPLPGQKVSELKGIDETTVRYSELNGSKFRIIGVMHDDLNLGHIELFSGRLGDAIIEGQEVTVTAFGSTRKEEQLIIGDRYSEQCRNTIYDLNCKVNPARYRVKLRVIGAFADGRFMTSITIPPPEELDPEENSQVATSVTESFLTGSGNFTVPTGCTELSVEIAAGSGSAGIILNSTTMPDPAAISGKSSSFGAMNATGGRGAFRYAGVGRSPIIGLNGAGANGDTNDDNGPDGGKVGNEYLTLAGPGASEFSAFDGQFLPDPVVIGGSGGHCAKTYTVGLGKMLTEGQVIAYSVGTKGVANSDATVKQDGKDGYIKLSIVTTTITTINEADKDQDWDFGSIQWTKGENICRISTIRDISGKVVTPMVNTLRPVQVGDEGYYRPGCTNYRSCCIERFNNLHNFRAEPDVPNITAATKVVVPTTATPPDPDESGNITTPSFLLSSG